MYASRALTNQIAKTMAQVIARQVEHDMTMARGYGYKVPKQYDVGVAMLDAQVTFMLDIRIDIAVRVQDHHKRGVVTMPSYRRLKGDSARDQFWLQVARLASTTVMEYLNKHPEHLPEPARALAHLQAIQDMGDDEFLKRVGDEARKAVFRKDDG